MSLLTPDLTGSNPLCKIENDHRYIILDNQTIEFHDSVFAKDIEVYLLGTITKPLIKDTDWSITEADKDYEAMSAMRLREKTFTEILVKSITIIKPHVADYEISLSYQRLYPVASSIALQEYPDKVDFTPEAWYDALEMLKRHDLLLAPIHDIHAISPHSPILLEPDPNKELVANKIVGEIYTINVPNKIAVIHPANGAFFKDSVSIIRDDTKAELIEGEDYIVYGYDSAKTRLTSNKSGVYKFIGFEKPFVCDVIVSYHAYGGDPTLSDIKAHDETINNIIEYITNSQLLTSETVKNAPVITNIVNKLVALEENMRKLAQSGRPNYGDVTTGTSLLKKIAAPDQEFHWWTIAELYKVSGSPAPDEVFISDTAVFSIQTLYTKFAFTAYINVNLDNPVNVFDVKVPTSLYPLGYIPYEDYTNLEFITRPQFRIIWNANTVQGSGIYLQIGMQLKTVATETIVVEDMSGHESCWKLIPEVDTAVLPEDTLITLPSGNHVWDKNNSDSRLSTYLIPLTEGHIVWAGSEVLNRPSGRKIITLTHFLEDNVDLTRIKKIRYDMEEEDANRFPVYIEVNSRTNDLLGTQTFYYNGKPAYMNGRIRRNPQNNKIEIMLDIDVTAGLASTQLNLRQVVIYT